MEGSQAAVDFSDTKTIFENVSTASLLRAYVVLQVCRVKFIADHAESLLSLSRRILGADLTRRLIKSTFFAHFCAGETKVSLRPTMTMLRHAGVGSILDYAAEAELAPAGSTQEAPASPEQPDQARTFDYESEARCDAHLETFLGNIDAVADAGPDGFAAIKVSALGDPQLLGRMSACISELRCLFRKFDLNDDGQITAEEFSIGYDAYFYSFPGDDERTPFSKAALAKQWHMGGGSSFDYLEWTIRLRLEDLPELMLRCRHPGRLHAATLRHPDAERLIALRDRVVCLARHAKARGVRLMIDAEQCEVQPAIDNCVLELQATFNACAPDSSPVVFNTYQCYLKGAQEVLDMHLRRAKRLYYRFAAKLVRGAYMRTERARAADAGVASPVHDTLEDTHRCYDASVAMALDDIARGSGAELMIATHNQRSVELAVAGMGARGLCGPEANPSRRGVYFGQLLGMADHLSFGLGARGYAVYKYLPWGPVDEAMPYLIRRAHENSDVFGGVDRDLQLIRTELWRRWFD